MSTQFLVEDAKRAAENRARLERERAEEARLFGIKHGVPVSRLGHVPEPFNCAGCGRQILLDDDRERCYFCGKSARKKEEPMNEPTKTSENIPENIPGQTQIDRKKGYSASSIETV